MSIEVYNLYQTDFDSFENKTTYDQKLLGMFFTDEHTTAHKKCSDFIRDMEMPKFYLGWDGQVYPKFVINKGYTR